MPFSRVGETTEGRVSSLLTRLTSKEPEHLQALYLRDEQRNWFPTRGKFADCMNNGGLFARAQRVETPFPLVRGVPKPALPRPAISQTHLGIQANPVLPEGDDIWSPSQGKPKPPPGFTAIDLEAPLPGLFPEKDWAQNFMIRDED